TDGIQPSAGLIEDASGNLYGTTKGGGSTNGSDCNTGSCGYGTVFKLTPSGSGYTESVLYNFCSQSQGSAACTDGVNPYAGLIEDASGNLYGTTNLGGTGLTLVNGVYAYGTVFMLAPSG